MSDSNSNQATYFDLHVTGIGYLNRVRNVTPNRADPFWAVDVSALHGSADNVEYTYFDCRVSGRKAQEVIEMLEQAIKDKKKVLVGFKIGDIYPDLFTYQSGNKKGQTGVSLKGRLLTISWAKIDGQPVELPGDDNKDSGNNVAEGESVAA